MPPWLTELKVGEIVAAAVAIAAVAAVLAKIWKPVRRAFKALEQIFSDWNGSAERRDASGQVIEPGRPGVMAQLETLRAQVQNSHRTNLRDDVDKVGAAVKEVSAKLDEHIEIAKQSDTAQERVVGQLERFTPMLEDLHSRYARSNQRGDT